MSGFSSILKITDVDDFITPSLECIKPVKEPVPLKSDAKVSIAIGGATQKPQKQTINLSDCLACSGCVTSAEEVLVQQQSSEQFRRVLEEGQHKVVVSICPQSVTSIAQRYDIKPVDCAKKLVGYLKKIGVAEVWDTNVARSISLMECANEFKEKLSSEVASDFTIISSACPGWICYAEKTLEQNILDRISSCRSPQQIMGSLVRRVWVPLHNEAQEKVFHVTVMPCFDKKLEASRKEFEDESTSIKDVDLVITSMEIESMLQEDDTDLMKERDEYFSDILGASELTSHVGSSSGGYADYIIHSLLTASNQLQTVTWKNLRNADLQEATIDLDGRVLRFCRAYGFRNLQVIVQKIKKNKKNLPHFIEMMACPSGCINGGAQIRPSDTFNSKELISSLNDLYGSIPTINPSDDHIASDLTNKLKGTNFAATSYKAVEKSTDMLVIKW